MRISVVLMQASQNVLKHERHCCHVDTTSLVLLETHSGSLHEVLAMLAAASVHNLKKNGLLGCVCVWGGPYR